MNLTELDDGKRAKIISLPDTEAAQRLEALGLHKGKIIEKISVMPFGGPVTVMLEGRHFAVAHSVALDVEVANEL